MVEVRLKAKGEKVEFDTEDGKKEYVIRPIKNKELLEVAKLADSGKQTEAALVMARLSINRDPKIVSGEEKPFSEEEMRETESVFLMDILKKAAKVNGIEHMFDFQLRQRMGQKANSLPSRQELHPGR